MILFGLLLLSIAAGLVASVIVIAIYRLADWFGQDMGWWQ